MAINKYMNYCGMDFRCKDCGCKTQNDDLKVHRCPTCQDHFLNRKKYALSVARTISVRSENKARKDRRTSKHCPRCRCFRPKEAYLRGSGPHGICEQCRNEDYTLEQIKQHNRRIYADLP